MNTDDFYNPGLATDDPVLAILNTPQARANAARQAAFNSGRVANVNRNVSELKPAAIGWSAMTDAERAEWADEGTYDAYNRAMAKRKSY